MSVYHRYFRFTDGPLIAQIDSLFEARNEASDLYKKIADKYGATEAHCYERSGEFAGFRFSLSSPPDKNIFRFVAKHKLWLPWKNVPSGKSVWEDINLLPKPKPIESILDQVGLLTGQPWLTHGNRWYAPKIWGFGEPRNIFFVSVPWKDVDPAELDAYRQDKSAGTCFDWDLEVLLWTPPVNWIEVKQWQIEKEAEEIKASEKQSGEEIE